MFTPPSSVSHGVFCFHRTWCSQPLTALPWSADILDAEIFQAAHRER